jgi:hypothetical protein
VSVFDSPQWSHFDAPKLAQGDEGDPSESLPLEPPDVDRATATIETVTPELVDALAGEDPEVTAGYSIIAAPRISLAAFAAVLSGAGSPAAPEAISIYNAYVQQGVDPAVGLAIFAHESNYGKTGISPATKSIGNSRYYGDPSNLGITPYKTSGNGTFASYPSYTVAAEDMARLLASSLYGKSADYSTTATAFKKYSPSGYKAYANAVGSLIAKWSGQAGTPSGPALDAHQLHVQHLANIGAGAGAKAGAAAGKLTSAMSSAAATPATSGGLLLVLAGGAILVLVLLVVLKAKPARPEKGED